MSITSANATLTISIPALYPVPQTMQQWAADDAFSTDAIQIAETRMGVDGYMTGGFTPAIVPMTLTLMPDSVSISVFDFLSNSMMVSKEIYTMTGTLLIPATGKSYELQNGILRSVKVLPDAKKVLDPQSYIIDWNYILPAAV
jgi:hypothetical protein